MIGLYILNLYYSAWADQRHRLTLQTHVAVQQLCGLENQTMLMVRLWKLDHGSKHCGVLEHARISNSVQALDYALSAVPLIMPLMVISHKTLKAIV